MTVYVLTQETHDGNDLIGLFADEGTAEDVKRRLNERGYYGLYITPWPSAESFEEWRREGPHFWTRYFDAD